MKFTIALPITKTIFLQETLDSIADQTETDFEVIIKNNGKNDSIKAEIKEICLPWLKLSNVQYYESDHQLSMPENFNTILEKANGKFFTVLSDDDVLEPDFLKEINQLTNKYKDTHVFHCRVSIINQSGEVTGMTQLCPEWESQIDFVYHRLASKRLFYLSDFVVKTSELKKIGGFNVSTTGWGLDEITWSVLAFNGVAYTDKPLLRYRLFPGNFTASKETLNNRFKDNKVIFKVQEKIILENCNKSDCPYDLATLQKINQKRTQGLNDNVLYLYLKSSSTLEGFKFYWQNKKDLDGVRAIKSYVKRKLLKQ
jgi:glycosyltransferase involved in cell wall biosynthesis